MSGCESETHRKRCPQNADLVNWRYTTGTEANLATDAHFTLRHTSFFSMSFRLCDSSISPVSTLGSRNVSQLTFRHCRHTRGTLRVVLDTQLTIIEQQNAPNLKSASLPP